jgi:hypothetical protein
VEWGLLAILIALVWPGTAAQLFDGLPLNTPWEFATLLVLLTYVHRPSRWRLARYVRRAGSSGPPLWATLASSSIVLKLLTLVLASPSGFAACYRPMVPGSSDSSCERSFDAPFAPPGVTRYDTAIDFQPDTWRLGFFNSLRFNYPPVPGALARDRLPFAADWRGVVRFDEEVTMRVQYVGEGEVLVGTERLELPASYTTPSGMQVRLPAGTHGLLARFRFDDGFRIGHSDSSAGPRPSFRVTLSGSSGAAVRPLRAIPPGGFGRLAAQASDTVIIAAAGLLVAALVAGAGRHAFWVVPLAGLLALATTSSERPTGASDTWRAADSVFDLLILFVPSLLVVPRSRRVPLAWIGLALICTAKALLSVPSWQWTAIRSAGNDWLTYESHARAILETWSLEGGEPVFYYQPLYRYIRFLQRIVFGEAEAFVMAISLLGLSFGFALLWLRSLHRAEPGARILATGALLGLLALMWSPEMLVFLVEGASEYPTWIALPFVLWLVSGPRLTASRALAAVALLACSAITRPNQLPAAALLSLRILSRARQRGRGLPIILGLLFGGVLLLPALHNLYYGGRVVFMTASAAIPENLVLGPARLWRIWVDPSVRGLLAHQIARVLYLVPGHGHEARFLFRLCQVTWLGAVALAASRAGRRQPFDRTVLVLPWVYLGPHLFLQTHVYYPRHIVAAHLAFALSAMWLACRGRAWLPRTVRTDAPGLEVHDRRAAGH